MFGELTEALILISLVIAMTKYLSLSIMFIMLVLLVGCAETRREYSKLLHYPSSGIYITECHAAVERLYRNIMSLDGEAEKCIGYFFQIPKPILAQYEHLFKQYSNKHLSQILMLKLYDGADPLGYALSSDFDESLIGSILYAMEPEALTASHIAELDNRSFMLSEHCNNTVFLLPKSVCKYICNSSQLKRMDTIHNRAMRFLSGDSLAFGNAAELMDIILMLPYKDRIDVFAQLSSCWWDYSAKGETRHAIEEFLGAGRDCYAFQKGERGYELVKGHIERCMAGTAIEYMSYLVEEEIKIIERDEHAYLAHYESLQRERDWQSLNLKAVVFTLHQIRKGKSKVAGIKNGFHSLRFDMDSEIDLADHASPNGLLAYASKLKYFQRPIYSKVLPDNMLLCFFLAFEADKIAHKTTADSVWQYIHEYNTNGIAFIKR